MKIEKENKRDWFYYYYRNEETDRDVAHALCNDRSYYGIGYYYHEKRKGFWLRYKNRL